MKRELGTRELSALAIACIVGTRWIPAAARAGSGAVLLWVFAALLFALPLAVSVASLTVRYPKTGGMYVWARGSYGPWHGFLCFFIYWIGIVLWFPGAAMFYVSMAAPSLAQHRAALVAASLAALWFALGSNMLGLRVGKWTNNAAAAAAWILAALLVTLAVLAWRHRGSASPLHQLPTFDWNGISAFSSIAFGMSGLEVLGFMGAEIRDPARTIPRAAAIASVFATVFYAVTTLALLVLVRREDIGELTGLAQAGAVAGSRAISAFLAVLVLVTAIGQFGGLGTSVSRMPFAAGVDGLLPASFARVHPRWGTPYGSMLWMGGTATTVLLATQLGDSAAAGYQTIVSLMVIAGFLPYLYAFGAAWKEGLRFSPAVGIAITTLVLACSLVPSSDIAHVWLFEGKLLAGTVCMIAAAWALYRRAAVRYHVGIR